MPPRVPLPLQLKILEHTLLDNARTGGADYMHKVKTVERLRVVSKAWQECCNFHDRLFPYLPFYATKDSVTGRNTTIDTKLVESLLRVKEKQKFSSVVLLRIDVDSGEDGLRYEERDRAYTRLIERSIKVMGGARQLELAMLDSDCGSYSQLIWRFPSLEKLCLSSQAKPSYVHLDFPPKPWLRSLPSTLVRLDLIGVVIKSWTVSIPSLKVLTLDHVKFGSLESTCEETSKTCRDFFASFPALESIAFNRLGRLNSDALSRLKVYGITQLRLGACAFACVCGHGPTDPASTSQSLPSFVECLARHFRCKIKHLAVPACRDSLLLKQVISSRQGQPHPPYLAKLQSVSLHSFPPVGRKPDLDARKPVMLEKSREWLDKAELREVQLKWMQGEQYEMTQWEPKIWDA